MTRKPFAKHLDISYLSNATRGGLRIPSPNFDQHHEISTHRLRLVAENVTDAVIEIGLDGAITWASSSIFDLLGFHPSELIGLSSLDLIDQRSRALASERRSRVLLGESLPEGRLRFLHASKSSTWIGVRARPIVIDDVIVGSVLGLTSRDLEMAKDNALKVLLSGSRTVADAHSLEELLNGICNVAVLDPPYVFAWYGSKETDGSVRFEAMSRQHREYLNSITVRWDGGPLSLGPAGRAIRTGHECVVDNVESTTSFDPWREAALVHGFSSSLSFPVKVDGNVIGAYTIYAEEPNAFNGDSRSVFAELAHQIGRGIERLNFETKLSQTAARNSLLANAIEHADDAVVITDANSVIVYANTVLFDRTGYGPDEVIGFSPRIFKSGLTPTSTYVALWSNLIRGESWSGQLVNRTKDGRLLYEDVSISPILMQDGQSGYVAVLHDRTQLLDLESQLRQHMAERIAVADLLSSVTTENSIEKTIQNICTKIMEIPLVDSVSFVALTRDGLVIPEIIGSRTMSKSFGNHPFPPEFTDHMERLREGSILLDTSQRIEGTLYRQMIGELTSGGTLSVALVPVSDGTILTGFVAIGSSHPKFGYQFEERLATFREIGAALSQIAGAQASKYAADYVDRLAIDRVISSRIFTMVFQPIVDMSTRDIVGYEALARFPGEAPPDAYFAEADRLGLLSKLEIACAEEALKMRHLIPIERFLSLNFSPETICAGELENLLVNVDNSVVVEVTEHATVANYALLKRAIAALPTCRLAVDDAGAGHASLRHIMELEPAIVKIDISLIRNVDTNPVKSSLVAGLMHFAKSSGTLLIAEGVETVTEASSILNLSEILGVNVLYGQGYLWGRAAPLEIVNH